jgi:hypothetical protein
MRRDLRKLHARESRAKAPRSCATLSHRRRRDQGFASSASLAPSSSRIAPWHFLNVWPLPQGHGPFRPIFPDDPYLLEQLATTLCDGGVADEADAAIENALERAAALDEDALARARATKAEILVRSDAPKRRARSSTRSSLRAPADTNAAHVKGLVYE